MKSLERQLAAHFGVPYRVDAQSDEPWCPKQSDLHLSAPPLGMAVTQDAVEVPLSTRPSLYWGSIGLFLGMLCGGVLSGFALGHQIGPRAWLGFGPLCVWALLALVRTHLNNNRRCRLSVGPQGIGVTLMGAMTSLSAEIGWSMLREVDVVTDKRGRNVLRLLGTQRTLYFGGASCHRKQLIWIEHWIATQRSRHGVDQE